MRMTKRSDEDKRLLITRVKKITGQMAGIGKMIDEDRYCDDILIQLSAIDKAIKSLANTMLEKHMNSCLVRDIKNDDFSSINEIIELFKRFQ